jgi:hypothetical protein
MTPRIARLALILPALLLPGLAGAQSLRSGPDAPAASAQVPPTSLPNEGGDRSGANAPNRPAGAPGTQSTDHVRTAPPPGHQTLGAPPVPGAVQPRDSEGFTTNRDRIPARDRSQPDASTTGR